MAMNRLISCSLAMSVLIQSGHRPLDVSKAKTRQVRTFSNLAGARCQSYLNIPAGLP